MLDRDELKYRLVDTEWGCFAFVARGNALVATWLPAPVRVNQALVRRRYPAARLDRSLLPGFVQNVRRYFSGATVQFDVLLDLEDCPPFHQRVYEACRRIPYGTVVTYRDLARAAGSELAGRAVGNAMAKNRLPLVVPCHRVLRTGGALGGFSTPQGVALKARMLRLEGVGVDVERGRVESMPPGVSVAVA